MKKLLTLLAIVVLIGCNDDNFPQTVTVIMPYSNVSAVVDSAFLLVWRGADASTCPMIDTMEVSVLDSLIKADNIKSISKYSVPITGSQYIIELPPSGEEFKVAGYVKDGKLTSFLAVKDTVYQLPTRPAMMNIGNIQMSY